MCGVASPVSQMMQMVTQRVVRHLPTFGNVLVACLVAHFIQTLQIIVIVLCHWWCVVALICWRFLVVGAIFLVVLIVLAIAVVCVFIWRQLNVGVWEWI